MSLHQCLHHIVLNSCICLSTELATLGFYFEVYLQHNSLSSTSLYENVRARVHASFAIALTHFPLGFLN